ncbi:remorin isoform X1 [Juglans microcarpa x Juglans regia]|uniref:remorin isoform X1 n=1 Tax=Juglans microcarpa x Juglans regia TaxID=2249226 RepID=UPI001B7E48C9|nr:remorin isoform X1 [Juglans microcarpa x Juglans regia]
MDAWVKQTRLRFPGVHKEKTEEAGSIRDRRIPLQKSQSFKEKKKSQNWLQRQFSRQMSQEHHSDNGIERAAAVAAAAFAIKRLEETHIPDPKKTSQRPETSLTAIKSIKEDKPSLAAEPGRTSKRFSGETSLKIPGSQESEFPITAKTPIQLVPSIKRTPTFVEHLNSNIGLNPETTPPKSEPPVTFKSTIPPNEIQRQSSTKPGTPPTVTRQQSSMGSVIEETKADAWEKAELAKIKHRYEKQKSTITSWEEKKKAKARRKLDRTEMQSELEGRRKHALEEFRDDIEFIDQIAGGARVKAEEKRNKKEIKAREKAKKIRTTGKEPKTCCCF